MKRLVVRPRGARGTASRGRLLYKQGYCMQKPMVKSNKVNKGGRPPLGDKALVALSARVPQGVLKSVDRYARQNKKTRSQAVVDLLIRGLDEQ
jgi:hypothetical protein